MEPVEEADDYEYVDLDNDEMVAILDLAEVLAEQGSELWKSIFNKLNATWGEE
ncbi:MAG TPA: hypothetical protein VFJ52_10645 [Terriglobia bacterium]|nr:hypothetical protein [Terriglobia bacterium]